MGHTTMELALLAPESPGFQENTAAIGCAGETSLCLYQEQPQGLARSRICLRAATCWPYHATAPPFAELNFGGWEQRLW